MDLFSLKGKKAIVTGGTRGLGYGIAEGLCRAGAEVAILGTSEKVRESADALAQITGAVVHGIVGDLVREEEVPVLWSSIFVTLVAKKYHESVTLPSGLRMVYDNH